MGNHPVWGISLVQSLSCVWLWAYELQHARTPCPSSTTRVYLNPCPLSRWCHPIMSSSVVPFSSCPQSFLTSGSVQMSQLFASGGQSIEVSASTSVLPMNIRTDLLYNGLAESPCSPRDSQESSPTPQFKSINSLTLSFLYSPNGRQKDWRNDQSLHDLWNIIRWISICIMGTPDGEKKEYLKI